MLIVAIGGAVVAWAITRSEGATAWTSVNTSSGLHSVEMPGSPTRQQEETDASGIVLPVEVLSVGSESLEQIDVGAVFVEADLSAVPAIAMLTSNPEQAQLLLETQARTIFETAGITFEAATPAESPLGPAVRQSGRIEGRGLVVRGFAALGRSAAVAVLVVDEAGNDEKADRTLDRIVGSLVAMGEDG